MMLKIFLLVISAQILKISSLKSTEFCKINQLECKGNYDSSDKYRLECSRIKCSGKHKYKCGEDKCTISQQECDAYLHLANNVKMFKYNQEIQKYFFLRSKEDSILEREKKRLKDFNKNMPNCTLFVYQFSSRDFCVNGLNCLERKKILKSSRINYIVKQTSCRFPDTLSYQCSKHFCSSNDISCNNFKMKNFIQNSSMIIKNFNIKRCGNDRTVITKLTSSIF